MKPVYPAQFVDEKVSDKEKMRICWHNVEVGDLLYKRRSTSSTIRPKTKLYRVDLVTKKTQGRGTYCVYTQRRPYKGKGRPWVNRLNIATAIKKYHVLEEDEIMYIINHGDAKERQMAMRALAKFEDGDNGA